jgi:SET domain-containing protein
VIDATQGNLTRFINHSRDPNLQPIHVFYDGFYHLIFIALRKIQQGEELSYDYGQSYWYLRDPPVLF